ncbi:MAG: hypothetical protein ACI9T8_000265 [Candidatus Saccharimonadales bacterium]|jgi:hypothetical protein
MVIWRAFAQASLHALAQISEPAPSGLSGSSAGTVTKKKDPSYDESVFLVAHVASSWNGIIEELSRWKLVYRGGVSQGSSGV